MKTLLILAFAVLAGCQSPQNPRKMKVRVTTYSSTEKKCDKWTRRGQSSTGIKLKDRAVLAANPADIPYFSNIKLPCFDYLLPVIDTGMALKSRKAALAWGQNVPVIDVYFKYERDAMKFRAENPMFMDILIFN